MGLYETELFLDDWRGGAVSATEPVIMVAEGSDPRYQWRQYFVITDGRCAIVEMLPAMLCGWKFHRVTVQSGEDWPGMSRDDIVRYKQASAYAPHMAPELGDFRAKLLEKAGL